LAREERDALLEALAAREGERWPAVRAGIEQAVADLAVRGFVVSAGDWKEEINAVGVPLPLGTGSLSFALNCGGPAFLMPRDRLVEEIGPRLAELAARIMARMNAA
jgi:DNA-binding IclR family transcriptional regulator